VPPGSSGRMVGQLETVRVGTLMDLSPFLRQTVKTQNSANGMKMPLKGELSHGFVSTAVHEGVQAGGDRASEDGASIAEVARAFEVNPNLLHRWRREFRQGPGNAFPGLGKRRWDEGRVVHLERKIGQQTLEIDFLKGCLQRIDEQRKLQALNGKPLSTSRSKPKGTETRA
jgi:transposase